MSGKDDNVIVPLKDFLLMRVEQLEKKTEALLNGHTEASEVARLSMEKRLDTMNEFREALKDAQSSFVTRKEHDFITSDIRMLREAAATMAGKASLSSVLFSYGLAVTGLILSIISLFLKFSQ